MLTPHGQSNESDVLTEFHLSNHLNSRVSLGNLEQPLQNSRFVKKSHPMPSYIGRQAVCYWEKVYFLEVAFLLFPF